MSTEMYLLLNVCIHACHENWRCESHTLRTDVGLNKFLPVPSIFTVRCWWKSVQEIAHNDAEFRDNRR
jgi:hypothetical protein